MYNGGRYFSSTGTDFNGSVCSLVQGVMRILGKTYNSFGDRIPYVYSYIFRSLL